MKKTILITVIVLIIAAVGITSFQARSPQTMMKNALEAAQTTGDIHEYLTGDAQRLFNKVDEGGSLLSGTGLLSEEQITNMIVKKMTEIDWELESINYEEISGTAKLKFKYSNIISIDGTIELLLVKEEQEGNFFERLYGNPWKIAGISNIDF